MELVIKTNGERTEIYLNGKMVERATMVMFSHSVGISAECVYELLEVDEEGLFIIHGDEIKRRLCRVDFDEKSDD